jgi:gamma-glutamyltranspeptidase / glutathione hydrolase
MDGARRSLVFGLGAAACAHFASIPAWAGDRVAGSPLASRSPVYAASGAVASSNALATQIGIAALRDGGSAVDAAIAVAAALAVFEPMMSGPGGDLFALIWDNRTGRLHGLESAGRAPRALGRSAVLGVDPGARAVPAHGWLSISLPGAVAGWAALHARFGRLPMARLLAPAIGYAQEGFPVGMQAASDWQSIGWIRPGKAVVGNLSPLRDTFAPGGAAPGSGTRFRNPDLARTMELVLDGGVDAFARGTPGRAIQRASTDAGQPIMIDELAGHAARWIDPISSRYRGVEIAQMPLPGQGLATLQLLALLERFDMGGLGLLSADHAHVLAEATRLVFVDRARLYADDAGPDLVDRLLSSDHIGRLQRAIDMNRAGQADLSAAAAIREGDTHYLTTCDAGGQMVSLITSVSGPFGSGIVAPGTGFVLQNRASSFALSPDHPNALAPGRKPFHTIIPAFALREGRPWLAFGVMGGDMQPQGQAQLIVNMIDHGLDAQAAGDAPRLRLVGGPQPAGSTGDILIRLESGWGDAVARDLRRRGHRVAVGLPDPTVRYGGFQAIEFDIKTGIYAAASDMRQDGMAAGF